MSSSSERYVFPDETESFEVFDLVTEALVNIDSYQELRRRELPRSAGAKYARGRRRKSVESTGDELLSQSAKCLASAHEQDKTYAKAEYLQAMVTYLRGDTRAAITQFNSLRERSPKAYFATELRYNLASAYSESGDLQKAISEFKGVIVETDNDPELNLLARAGLALTYFRDKVSSEGIRDKEATRKIEEQRNYIRERLRLGRILRLVLPDNGIDREVTRKVEQILDEALDRGDKARGDWRVFFRRHRRTILLTAIVLIAIALTVFLVFYLLFYAGLHDWRLGK